jgi:hypothetical protein
MTALLQQHERMPYVSRIGIHHPCCALIALLTHAAAAAAVALLLTFGHRWRVRTAAPLSCLR